MKGAVKALDPTDGYRSNNKRLALARDQSKRLFSKHVSRGTDYDDNT